MSNIWEVTLQGISVSITAGIVLIIKRLLEDKLSPRWQYGVWVVLFLRIITPVRTASYILQPVPLWIETLKAGIERNLSSAYTDIYSRISPQSVIPHISRLPVSITDCIFVIYIAGIIFMLTRYLIAYISIGRILKDSCEVSDSIKNKVSGVCEKYSLKSCNISAVKRLETAFVTGIFSPVLALPAGKETDEKIILHELIHLKYYDVLQNIIWSILKAFNWYNPFMWYVFDIIGNNMESLCDQRVLEMLEGEERRAYGTILLEMANEKYARGVGTSSISNGGKNIKKRIEAIVRFKKYPKGMAVVSVCIVFVLTFSLLGGYTKVYSYNDYDPHFEQVDKAMAVARTNRATTVAGAIDLYAKGLIFKNTLMIASVSPLDEHEAIEADIRDNTAYEKYLYDAGRELDFVNQNEGYRIFNLKYIDENNYEAMLMFHTNGLYDESGEGMLSSPQGDPYTHCAVAVHIKIYYDDGWCVEEFGERRIETSYLNLYQPPFDIIDAVQDMSYDSPYGNVRIRSYVQYGINNTLQNNDGFWNSTYFNKNPMAGAVFADANLRFYCEYDSTARTVAESPQNTYGIQLITVDSYDEEVKWPDVEMHSPVSGTSSDGFEWSVDRVREWDDEWHDSVKEYYGIVQAGSSRSVSFDAVTGEVNLHDMYRVRIFWDAEPVDEFVLTGGAK